MTDFYAALKRAIEGLDRDSAEARRDFYDNARDLLSRRLVAGDPPLEPSEVSRQRHELEEAIRRVEREIAAGAEIGRGRPQRRPERGRGGPAGRPVTEFDDDRLSAFAAPEPSSDRRGRPGGAGRRRRDDPRAADARWSEPQPRRAHLPTILLLALIVGAVVGLGVLAWSQRTVIAALFSGPDSGPADIAASGPVPVPPDTSDAADVVAQPPPAAGAGAATGPKALLIEAQPATVAATEGDTVLGASVDWQLVEGGTGGPEIRADLEVPARGMKVSLVIRRNADPSLPASHLVEVTTETPADFPGKGIRSIPGVALKPGEQDPAEPLAAASITVADGIFWIALSATEPEVTRNLWLLEERPWIDLPLVYESGQRAILTFEKGQEGTEAFERAFAVWSSG